MRRAAFLGTSVAALVLLVETLLPFARESALARAQSATQQRHLHSLIASAKPA